MELEIQTFGEAIIAAAHERISQRLNSRSWLEIVNDWNATGDPALEEQLRAVISELAQENLQFLGDRVAANLELPLH